MVAVTKARLKTAFKKSRVIAPLHTSGPVALTHDGTRLFTCVEDQVLLTDTITGTQICRFRGDTTSITSLTVSPSSTHLVVFYTSSNLRIYEIPPNTTPTDGKMPILNPIRTISKSHDAPVHVCRIDPSSTLLASGSADGVVKVWDLQRGYVTHMFKGHGGVVSALAFNYPRETSSSSAAADSTLQLITGSADTRLRIFDLSAASSRAAGAKAQAVLEGHVSVPRGLDVSPDGRWLISGGRDSVILIWELLPSQNTASAGTKGKGKAKEQQGFIPSLFKTVPVLERVEAAGVLRGDETIAQSSEPNDRLRFYTGGEKGVIRVWDAWEGKVLATYGEETNVSADEIEESREILDVIYTPQSSTLTSVHADQNILSFSLRTGAITRQHIGFNDEIIDAALVSPSPSSRDTHLALATNSSLVRIYNTSNLDAQLLSGHQGMVLCLDTNGDGTILASGSKDKSARLWIPSSALEEAREREWRCIGVAEGHAESIGAVALASSSSLTFMFTGSQDRTVKMWDVSSLDGVSGDEPISLKSLTTLKAHEKDINSLDVAPNDRLLATASQDKTANIYEVTYSSGGKRGSAKGEIKLLGTCKGHKRGVWSVKFSKTERFVATGSGDKTVRLWSLDDFSCLKTFEGHTNTVLRVDFITQGLQLVSTASDGLVKLWNIKDEECVTSLDNHEDKIWALAISSDQSTIVSGAADSVVTFWTDCTEEIEIDKENQRADLILKDQDFINYVALRDYRAAILLALSMDQPGRLFNLFKTLRASSLAPPPDDDIPSPEAEADGKSITGSAAVDEVIRTLPDLELLRLLVHVRDWNATARTSDVAQRVLHAILKMKRAEDITRAFDLNASQKGLAVDGDMNEGGAELTKVKVKAPVALKELVDGLVPYTERHLARADQLVQDSYVLDYVLGEMDMGLFAEEDLMDVDV